MPSRLSVHQQKKYRSQIFLYGVGLVVLIIFLATIGFKLLVNTSLFIAQKTHPKDASQNTNNLSDNLTFAPQLIDVPLATNSATIQIKGTAQGTTHVTLFVDDEIQKETKVVNDMFETTITLQKGENSIYAQAEKNKETKQSRTYIVFYDNEKPILEVSSPQDRQTVYQETVSIQGKTDTDAEVRINSLPVVVGSDGTFAHIVYLNPGDNKFMIEAVDQAGNAELKEWMIVYTKE